MNSVRKLIVLIAVSLVFLFTVTPMVSADSFIQIDDNEDDVIVTSGYDLEDEFVLTSEKPNIDITKITYEYSDQTNEATITLEVKGSIEDKNTIDEVSLSGAMIQYFILLETSGNTYEIEYLDQNCTSGLEPVDYVKSGSTLTVTLELADSSEEYVSIYGYSMEFDIASLTELNLYMDIAPDEALFVASASGPSSGESGESISFASQVEDILDISSPPYTYTWDFDDGTPEVSGENPTHIFQYAGDYTVELTVEDSTGKTATAQTFITITTGGSNNNGGTNNGGTNNGGSDNNGEESDSSFMLFIGVVVIIIIIAMIALVVVIRR